MKEQPGNSTNKLSWLNITLFVLSIYVFLIILVDTLFQLPKETSRLLEITDFFICIFFLFDFLRSLYLAESKVNYMKWGWLDLLASVPMINFLRFGRLLRIIRILRLVKAFRTTHALIQHIYANKARGTFNSVVLLCVLLVLFGSIAILQFETSTHSNIKTAEDALYWAFTTVFTFGHEELYATTTFGRVVEGILIVSGMGLVGTFTAYVASWFIGKES